MWKKLIKFYVDTSSKISLKARFVAVIFINSFVVLALTGYISYYNIKNTYESKVQDSVQSELDSMYSELNTGYDNLSYITKQFAYENTILTDGTIGNNLENYINYIDGKTSFDSDNEVFSFVLTLDKLRQKVDYIAYSNPAIGNVLFFRAEDTNRILYSSKTLDTKDLEVTALYTDGNMSVNGIHKSIGGGEYYVISAEREMHLQNIENIYVYVETNSQWLKGILKETEFGMDSIYLMTDSSNHIIYSQDTELFPLNDELDFMDSGKSVVRYGKYYLFCSKESGWKIIEAIKKEDYEKEIIKWVYQFIVIVIVSLAITTILAIFIWKKVYQPVKVFRREIQLMAENQPTSFFRRTRVREFDELLNEFYQAKASIIELHKQIAKKEKRQKELEIEKLLIQINPHFIHNTLNCIQWMARLCGQKDIEKMVTLFTRILNYNLGKNDIIVTLNEEINALDNYVELQKMKNGFHLNVVINVDQALKDVRIPRFILQPLVENAAFHGTNINGSSLIKVVAKIVDDQNFIIIVEDNGKGMSAEEIDRILNSANKHGSQPGTVGIGLQYVNGMIKYYYGEQYHIDIESTKGKGTIISIRLPLRFDEGNYDKGIDS